MDEKDKLTWPTMETPRSLTNHGRFCVMAVIVPDEGGDMVGTRARTRSEDAQAAGRGL